MQVNEGFVSCVLKPVVQRMESVAELTVTRDRVVLGMPRC